MAETQIHRPRPSMPDWRRHLISAVNEHEIVRLTREFVATWLPEDISRLPAACRPGRIVDAQDISQWAYELARAHTSLRYADEVDGLIVRMLSFASEAAVRNAEVKAVEAAMAKGA